MARSVPPRGVRHATLLTRLPWTPLATTQRLIEPVRWEVTANGDGFLRRTKFKEEHHETDNEGDSRHSGQLHQCFQYDGKEVEVKGAPYDVISAKRVDANTTSFKVRKTGGKFRATGKNVVSKDGKTLTQSSTGTRAEGKQQASTLVFDRQ